ncbi:MAG: hypothetical protein GY716_08635 [bacterium]|nr:hypothetical protein [bacterium]
MNSHETAQEPSLRLDAVVEATDALLDAVHKADPQAIDEALTRRGETIRSLELALEQAGGGHPPLDTALLRERSDEAFAQLEQLREQLGTALQRLRQDAGAIRSYTAKSQGSGVLERVG